MRQLVPRFDLSDISVVNDGNHYQPPIDIAQKIEDRWSEIIADASVRGGQVWNGLIYRLDHLSKKNEVTVLHLGSVDFKAHQSARDFIEYLQTIPEKNRPNGLIIGAYLITSDNQYVFGNRSASSILANKTQFIGGNLNKDEKSINSASDIVDYFVKELNEETGFDQRIIKSVQGLGIFENDNYKIAIILKVKLSITGAEFIKNAKLNEEHINLIAITQPELEALLNNSEADINPMISQTYNLTLV